MTNPTMTTPKKEKEKKKKKTSWLKRLFNKSPDAIQLKRLRQYSKNLREALLKYRRRWQTSRFYEGTSKRGYVDIPKKLVEFGMIDCLPLVEKRHMTNLLLLNERQRIARKAGDALACRIKEVEALIQTCSETKTVLALDDSFFINPETIVTQRGSSDVAEDFERSIAKRLDDMNRELEEARFKERLESPLSNEESTELLVKAVRLAGDAELKSEKELENVLRIVYQKTKRASSSEKIDDDNIMLRPSLVTRCLWWERPTGLRAYNVATASLLDQRTVLGGVLESLRIRLEQNPPRHRGTIAMCMSLVTTLVRRRSPIQNCFRKAKVSKAVRLLQLILERQLIGPKLRRKEMRETCPRDRVFEAAASAALKAGPKALGVCDV